MKKLLAMIVSMLTLLSIVPAALAVNVGSGITPDIETEDFEPLVWMCDSRVVYDDATEPGRISNDGEELVERTQNYAFEGEQIMWTVLVMDKNGIQKVEDVYGTVGDVQGAGNPIEVNCVENSQATILPSCNARIDEEEITVFDPQVHRYYDCLLTVETPLSMYGEYWITVEAVDLDGLVGIMAENEYWFLNPVIALAIDGDLTFSEVRPGTSSYSTTLLVGNDADDGSGVQLDMFISGTDFFDSSSSGAACPTSNTLVLGNGDSICDLGTQFGGASGFNNGGGDPWCYFATHGAYDTLDDARSDVEGYVGINYGIGFNDPNPFYGTANGDGAGYEIIQGPNIAVTAPYFAENVVVPGSEIAVTFRLNLPEPCNGDFDSGAIYFWGEAI